jgi:hypothetical protein
MSTISANCHSTSLHFPIKWLFVGSCVIAITFLPPGIHAQQKDSCLAGVFVTQDDFLQNRLSHQIDTKADGHKLDFSFPADLTLTLKIVTPDQTVKFAPGKIYGYAECGKVSRYFRGGKELNAQEDYYKIEEAVPGFVLYSSEFVSGNEIFYSTDLTSDIHRLRLSNLKRDFKDKPEFIAKAKKLKKRPEGLATRDENGFRIVRFFQGS